MIVYFKGDFIVKKEKVILLYLPFETGFPVLLTGQE